MAAQRAAGLAQQFVAAPLGLQHAPGGGDEGVLVGRVAALPQPAEDGERPHMVLRGAEHRLGQRLQRGADLAMQELAAVSAALLGQQRDEEGGLLQRIGHIVGQLHQRDDRTPARQPLGLGACPHDEVVGLAFPGLGPCPQPGGGLGAVVATIDRAIGQRLVDRLGQGLHPGGVLGQQIELGAVLLHVPGQQQPGLVGHQRGGLVGRMGAPRQRQHVHQEGLRRRLAEHGVQPVADAEGTGAKILHGVEDELLAARLQPGAVADLALRRLAQHLDRQRLGHEGLQALAGAVPVDQEDDAGADALQRQRERGLVGAGEGGRAELVGRTLVEVGADLRLRRRPLCAQLRQPRLEEGEARLVQVGVGQADAGSRRDTVDGLAIDHLDHQHMRVVGADVVLDQQVRAVAGRGGVEAGVVELEGAGAAETAHEGGDAWAVLRADLPGVGAVDHLAGERGREAVQRLVQVHHQQVQAVVGVLAALAAVAVGQRAQVVGAERGAAVFAVRLPSGQVLQPVVAALAQGGDLGIGGVVHFTGQARDRPGHGGQGLVEQRRQPRRLGQQEILALLRRAGLEFVEPAALQAGRGAFGAQILQRLGRLLRMGRSRLQQGQRHLEPVIGRQRRLHPGGPQEGGLTE